MVDMARSAGPGAADPGRDRLHGRRVLVVGGGQQVFDAATDPVGNGRAIASVCAREGASVAVADRMSEGAEVTAQRIRRDGGVAHVLVGDASDPADADRVVDEAVTALGGLDGVVYNVGISVGGLGLDDVDSDDWDTTFAVNVRGAMLTVRAALRVLPERSSIVMISSLASVRSSSRLVAYGASKAALSGLLRYVTDEAAGRRVRANIVMPGLVDTPNGRRAGADRPSRSAAGVPMGRMATGWDIAYATLFFLSHESGHVTGQVLAVDGGATGV